MKWLDLSHNLFDGSISLEALPERMEFLDVSDNKFCGVNLASLPDTLKKTLIFSAYRNKLSGSVDLTRLPAALVRLYLIDNQLSGPVVLTQLPGNLKRLHLGDNQFNGSLDLTQLPPSLSELILDNNAFSGTVDLSQLPQRLEKLYLSENDLSGEVFISHELFDGVDVRNTKIIKRLIE
ncbi:leucine-rich repeat receptor-like protein kinase PEPR2-like protein [Perkinsela sp. CCAP 1560/4]|nr:leucine-rich repeat receptor-like protein kinase PEPR2-like protein [Perkinsela sp. CCAP 1560/4]|eukprot:KNH08317.1 leucine-rich repeat receptor-like protein kinase PEPR2-like protein [Perkinsela sp. CCAP 1560/4]